MNLLLDDPEKPTVWRGPIVNNLIRQLYMDVDWGELHYLLIDLPPGTSDAPLTVFQSFALSGVVVVTTPQDLARMIVSKSANMARMLNVPILGLVENMAYSICSHCGRREDLFGEPKGEEIAEKLGAPFLGSVPLDPRIAGLSDAGRIEDYQSDIFTEIARRLRINVSTRLRESPRVTPIAWRSTEEQKEKRKFVLNPS